MIAILNSLFFFFFFFLFLPSFRNLRYAIHLWRLSNHVEPAASLGKMTSLRTKNHTQKCSGAGKRARQAYFISIFSIIFCIFLFVGFLIFETSICTFPYLT